MNIDAPSLHQFLSVAQALRTYMQATLSLVQKVSIEKLVRGALSSLKREAENTDPDSEDLGALAYRTFQHFHDYHVMGARKYSSIELRAEVDGLIQALEDELEAEGVAG